MTVHRRDISDLEALRAAAAWADGPPPRLPRRNVIPLDGWLLFPAPPGVYEALAATYPPKVVEAKLYHMVDRGLLEYGVSIAGAWPTDAGRALLTALDGT